MSDSTLAIPSHRRLLLPPPGTAGQAAWRPVWSVPAAIRALQRAADLADFYERVAEQVGPPRHDEPAPVVPPDWHGLDGADGRGDADELDGAMSRSAAPRHFHPRALWVREHLHHLGEHAPAITAPAEHVAELRRVPWWR